jgi:hypothetical protein
MKFNKKQNKDEDSVFSDDRSGYSCDTRSKADSLNLVNDHMAFFKKSNMLTNNRMHEKKFMNQPSNEGENGYLSQFEDLTYNNPSDPVSSNNVPNMTGNLANIERIEMERDLALRGNYSKFESNRDLTYGMVDEKNFVHNNMVPFFKSGTGKGYAVNSIEQKKLNDTNQRRMELFSGSTAMLEYKPKTERRPLFNPLVGLTWIYGTPNFTDYYETRFMPGRERRNEFLHQPVRITPGLNLGYNEISKQGYQDTWRPLPKTVDQLRTADKPKISYGSVIIPGKKGERRGIIPNVAKHRPVTFREQDPRDFVKGLGYYRAPSIYGNFDVPNTNRQQTTRAWYGPVEFPVDASKPESLMEKFKIPFRENFLSDTPRNITGVDQDKNKSLTANTYYAKPTNRITTEINGYLNPAFHTQLEKGYAFDMQSNIPDPTLRNVSEIKSWINPALTADWKKGYAWDTKTNIPDPTLRNVSEQQTWLNPTKPEWAKSYAWNTQTNIPDPTLRNTTELKTWLNPTKPEWAKSYAWDTQTNIPDPTLRNTTELKTWLNPTKPEWAKSYAWDTQTNVPDPTLRNTTELKTWLNPTKPEWAKSYAWDTQTNVPDPTLRNTTELKTWLNPTKPEWAKSYAWDTQTNVPDPTLRNTTELKTWLNPTKPEWAKSYAWDTQTNIPDPTLRNTTEKVTQLNPAQTEWKKGYAWDTQTNIPDPTLRNTTEKVTWLNPTKPEWAKSYAFDMQTNIPDPTLRNTTEKVTQLNPAQTEWKKGYAFDMQSNIPDPTIRNTTEKLTQINPAQTEWKKGYAFDMKSNIPDPTLRNLTEVKTYQSPVGPNEREKSYAFDMKSNIPDPTLRNLTEVKTYQSPVGPGERAKSYAFDMISNIPDPTLRNLTEVKTYQAPMILHEGTKTRTRSDANNSLVNIGREKTVIVRDGGAPTTSNYNVGPVYDYTMVQICEPIQVNRDLYGTAIGQRPLQCTPTMYTRIPNELPQQSWRFDTCVVSNLATNPYVNNLVHKSVEY